MSREMGASFKKRLRRRKARIRRKIYGHRKSKTLLYRFAIHEVGHYVVKAKLCPDIPIELSLKRNGWCLIGKVYNPEDQESQDPYEIMIKVAIAGAIFETYRVGQVERALTLLSNTKALREDWKKFAKAKIKLAEQHSAGHSYVLGNFNECFAHLKDEILTDLREFGWDNAEALAWRLVEERLVTLPPLNEAS